LNKNRADNTKAIVLLEKTEIVG